MGQLLTKIYNKFARVEGRVLCLGLDNAGKTTVLYKLQIGEVICTLPTVGFNVESLKYRNVDLTVWDIGGQMKIRRLWRYYYENTTALIFVVDANDVARFDEARTELWLLLTEPQLKDVPLLVFANKQDLPKAANIGDLADKLQLANIKHRPWYIQASCATTGDGLYEGLDWLCDQIIHIAKTKSNHSFFFHLLSYGS